MDEARYPSRPTGRYPARRAGTRLSLLLLATGVASHAAALELLPDQDLAPTLVAGEVATYTIDTPAGTAVTMSLRQRDGLVDVELDAAGEPPLQLRTEAGRDASIEATLDGNAATRWTVTARPRKAGASFDLSLSARRATSERDAKRLAALRVYAQAETLRRANYRETATANRDLDAEARATRLYDEAEAQFRAAADGCGVLRTLTGRARLEVAAGRYAPARESVAAALATDCDPAPAERAQALKTLGMAAAYQGDYAASVTAARAALALYAQTGDRRYQGIVLGNLSAVYVQQGATDSALEAANAALGCAQASGDAQGIVFTRKTIAAIELARGNLALALSDYRRTLEDLRSTPYPMIEGETWNDLGILYHRLADFDGSLRAYREARRVWQRMHYRTGSIDTTLNEGEALLESGGHAAATRAFARALSDAQADGLQSLELRAWRGLAAAHLRAHDPARAREDLARSLAIAQATGELAAQSYALRALADLERQSHHGAAALALYAQALALARSAADRDGEAATLERRARLLAELTRLDEAAADIDTALGLIESQRGQINDPSLRTSYSASVRRYYATKVDILMGLEARSPGHGHAQAALAVADGARARSLQDLFDERAAPPTRAVDPALAAAERRAAEALNVAALALARLGDDAPAARRLAVQDDFDDARHRLDEARGELRRAAPRFAELVHPEPLSIDEIRDRLLDDGTTLVEYWLGDERSYAWLVSRRRFVAVRLPGRARNEQEAGRLRRRLRAPPASAATGGFAALAATDTAHADADDPAVRLGTMLIGGTLGAHTTGRVALVADGGLQLIPFALLRASPAAAPLGAGAELTYLPSISTLRWLRRGSVRRGEALALTIVADPTLRPPGGTADPRPANALQPLPWARHEAEAIASLVPASRTTRLLGSDATREAVLSARWQRTSIAHFATHAIVDLHHAELSGIVLSQYDKHGRPIDGMLRIDDIYDLDAPLDLVVLSGCETGVGPGGDSEGVYSLARAFFFAGSSRVVASLWAVDDRASAAFMAAFYRSLIRDARTPAMALRAAQREIAATPRWASEYYWAGFVLQGDWR